jgi:hypothetical protein
LRIACSRSSCRFVSFLILFFSETT